MLRKTSVFIRSRRTHFGLVVLQCVGLLAIVGECRAELPSIRFDRMQPMGVVAGGSVEVNVVGRDLEDVKSLRFDRPGITAEFLKPNQFKITVAGDVPEGTYDVQLVGRFGVSNSRLLAVSRDLSDVAETEPNDEALKAQVVPLNSAINGSSDGNGQDSFKFTAKRGERVVIDCQAARLDSQLDGNLILSTADGQILGNNGDYHGRDPFLDFVPPADGEYIVIVHDLSYRGGQPYRLLITTRPQVENVFPRAVQGGRATEIAAYGRNLKGGQPSPWTVSDLPLDEFRFSVTAPTDLVTGGRFQFLEHPSDHSVLPTAATAALDGFQVRAAIGGGALHPACLVVTDSPVAVENEPNDDKQQPQVLVPPVMLSARFDKPRDADWYAFEPQEAGNYTIEVFCERIAGRADPYVLVIDDKDNQVNELDDSGPRINAFDGFLRDPVGSVSLQAKKTYRLLVQDRYSRGGARYQYVLAIRRPVPDFHVAVIHSENPGPSGTAVWSGGSAFLDVVLQQRDGFNGPVTITAEGLPAGVHAAPTVINANTRGTFVFWADAGAAEWTGAVKLIATGRDGDKLLTREVRPYNRVWTEASNGSSRPMRDLPLAIRDKSPYSLKIVPEKSTVEAGKKAELKLVVERFWPEFRGKVTAISLAFPGGFNMGTVDVPEGRSDFPFTIDVPQGARPGEYTMSVLGQAQVPYNKDPQADSRPNTLVSMPSQPVTITVVAPEKK